MLLYQILAFTIHGKNKLSGQFELPDGSYSVSDIQNYFDTSLKKHETVTYHPLIMLYVNKIENRITFKIKTEYYLELFNT